MPSPSSAVQRHASAGRGPPASGTVAARYEGDRARVDPDEPAREPRDESRPRFDPGHPDLVARPDPDRPDPREGERTAAAADRGGRPDGHDEGAGVALARGRRDVDPHRTVRQSLGVPCRGLALTFHLDPIDRPGSREVHGVTLWPSAVDGPGHPGVQARGGDSPS